MYKVKFKDWDCYVQKTKYFDGNTALVLIDQEDSTPVAVATINHPLLEKNEVGIKNYSENTGMLEALEDAGIVQQVRTIKEGYITIPVCRLLIE